MAKWKQDPQGRDFVEEVTEVIELPIYYGSAKGKFRPWLKETWNKIENKDIAQDETIKGISDNVDKIQTNLDTKQDKTDNNLQTDAKNVVEGINEVAKYTDGLATSKTVNSFPLSQATEGEVYRVPQTNKYVICIENYNGSEISLPNANFEELSTNNNREHFNNLINKKIIGSGYPANMTLYEVVDDYDFLEFLVSLDGGAPHAALVSVPDTPKFKFYCGQALLTSANKVQFTIVKGKLNFENFEGDRDVYVSITGIKIK